MSEIKFPVNKNLNTEENVLVQLKEPSKHQNKANQLTTYTKIETDGLLNNKLNI